MKRVVIAAGGTGGHFFPGVSLAEELRARGWEALFLVRTGDPALGQLAARGLPGVEVDLRGLPRKLSPDLLTFGPRVVRAFRFVGRVLDDFRPSAAVGMGGYLTFPLAAAAATRRLPRLAHESNAVLGLANKAAEKLGAKVLWGLPPLNEKGEVIGTPIRAELRKRMAAPEARVALGLSPDKLTVLVFGGSQGARGINRELPAALSAAARKHPGRIQVIHLAGGSEADAAKAGYAGAPLTADVRTFLSEMDLAYGAADLVVCRSGASTLAELCAQRAPAILVPFPSAAGGHQEDNARLFDRAGAARLIVERDLPAKLAPALDDLLFSPDAARLRGEMSRSHEKLGLPDPATAARRLADAVERAAAR